MISQSGGSPNRLTVGQFPKSGNAGWLKKLDQNSDGQQPLTSEDLSVIRDVMQMAEVIRPYDQAPGIDKDKKEGGFYANQLTHVGDDGKSMELRDTDFTVSSEGKVGLLSTKVTRDGVTTSLTYARQDFDNKVHYMRDGVKVTMNSNMGTLFMEPESTSTS